MTSAQPTQLDVAERAADSLHVALGDRLVAIVLFGSRARGDATADSDWDLLVIAEGLPERTLERHFYLKRSLPLDCRGAISILARTPDEFEMHLPSLYLDIALDGTILYDPRGYAARKLLELQNLLARKGLYRERTPNGDRWHWKQEPTNPWSLEWGR
ncbi:MAG: nucleotidyltransferase domain-containing protein [Chloroflexi bacterium]|nr:nucleotidyltransferase domain-containing protein [Chloroflexota bacterium]